MNLTLQSKLTISNNFDENIDLLLILNLKLLFCLSIFQQKETAKIYIAVGNFKYQTDEIRSYSVCLLLLHYNCEIKTVFLVLSFTSLV